MNDIRGLICSKTFHRACLRLFNSIITDALMNLFIVLPKEYLSYAAFLFSPLSSTHAPLLALDPHTQPMMLKEYSPRDRSQGREVPLRPSSDQARSDPWVPPHLCLHDCLLSCFHLGGTHLFYFVTDLFFFFW